MLWFQVSVTVEPIGSDTAVLPGKATADSQSRNVAGNSSASTVPPATRPSNRSRKQDLAQSSQQQPAESTPIPGALRIGNQTDQPLRVALLAKQPAANSTAKQHRYSEPVHWDFAPGEGSSQGLVLSLPQGSLKLKPGDVIVAFAEDGSRRYWGPYVVGETELPVLDRKTSEWQLILKP